MIVHDVCTLTYDTYDVCYQSILFISRLDYVHQPQRLCHCFHCSLVQLYGFTVEVVLISPSWIVNQLSFVKVVLNDLFYHCSTLWMVCSLTYVVYIIMTLINFDLCESCSSCIYCSVNINFLVVMLDVDMFVS